MKKTLLLFFISSFFLISGTIISANEPGLPDSLSGAPKSDPVTLCDPLAKTCDESGKTSPQILIGKVINAVLGIVGSIALVMFIYGGFTWMTAAGNEQSVTKGKDILIWATVGLIIIFSAYALVRFVFTGIGASS